MGLARRAVRGVRRTKSSDVARIRSYVAMLSPPRRSELADDKSRRSLRRLERDLNVVDAGARRTCATPPEHTLDSCVRTLKDNLHATVREVACRPEHPGDHRLATYAVAKVDALHEPGNKQSTPNHFAHTNKPRVPNWSRTSEQK